MNVDVLTVRPDVEVDVVLRLLEAIWTQKSENQTNYSWWIEATNWWLSYAIESTMAEPEIRIVI